MAERVQEDSLSCVRRALEKNAEGKHEILLIRFSRVAEDEISGFLKTRDRESKVFLTDFVAKKTASGTIEYLDIGETRIKLVRGNRVHSTAKRANSLKIGIGDAEDGGEANVLDKSA